jgi:hypothetical protein
MAIKPTSKTSTQVYLEISTIRDGVIILKNGEYRVILEAAGVNFFLRSAEEQNSVIGGFANFLNSLRFHIQVVVQSRYIDLDYYINDLRNRINKQSNPFLAEQTSHYATFIEQMISQINVMEKRFFVVVPYTPLGAIKIGFFGKIMDALNPTRQIIRKQSQFEKNKIEIKSRADQISSGLSSMGISTELLNTQEIIDLFYRSYNPNSSQKQKLTNSAGLDAEVVLGKSYKKDIENTQIFAPETK